MEFSDILDYSLYRGDQINFPFYSHPTTTTEAITRSRRLSTRSIEKRDNHTISEQKRRQAVRQLFQEMTDLVPSLKDKGCSKSGILFKGVGYIKHLETKNNRLREKLESLRIRAQVERVKTQEIISPPGLPQSTLDALLLHKQQQRQLDELQFTLQNQLRRHKTIYHSISIPSNHALIIPHHHEDK
ncbi:hypothetical protein G6F56_012636 [Rhizopus delemar]|nr:hypothetical protein G6F56_012636 [Rhizopus delemar]